MPKIFLIGYMGSGKTTIGNLLAQKLNLPFIDMDIFIENRFRKSIPDIFREKGEQGFREIERKILEEISEFEDAIISTGGGLPCFYDNMKIMNQFGYTIYLKSSPEKLALRLNKCKHNRPLIKDKNLNELRSFTEESLKNRESFYNKAALIINIENLSSKKEMDNIIADLITLLSKEAVL